jgi:hypothetical protein
MKYLLIDFGASFVKSAIFDDSDNKIRNYTEIQSPFIDADSLQLSNLKNILDSINAWPDSDGINFVNKTDYFDRLRNENFAKSHPEIAVAMGYVHNKNLTAD